MKRKPEHSHFRDPRSVADEIGVIRKGWQNRIRIALVYPNTYRVGMSNLGFQTVYRIFNARPEVVCERVFLQTDQGGSPSACSEESGRPLRDFDIVAFSLSFENDYPHILTILGQAGIPPAAIDRGDPPPLVVAGGVACLLNPEPIAAFFDCFLIGEAEVLIPSFLAQYDPGQARASQLLRFAREVEGAYVPSLYKAAYDTDGRLSRFDPVGDVPPRVSRVYPRSISELETRTTIVSPDAVFDSTYLVEVSRGCPHGCRFCCATHVYRPYRYRSVATLERCLTEGSQLTERIGLVGTAVTDLPGIDMLCRGAVEKGIRLSFSSLRADKLSSDTLAALRQGDTRIAAIAPDAGSQRMRDVIRKGLRDDDITDAVASLVDHGIPNVKLYFMIGLPTETTDDIDGIVHLCRRVKDRFLTASKRKGRMGDITVSVSSFVPKPATPFQWAGMDTVPALKRKMRHLRKELGRIPNIRIHVDTPRWSYIQALLSRGDRRVSQILEQIHRFPGSWSKVLNASPLDTDSYVCRDRRVDEKLPWDFIDHGLSKPSLWREYQRAIGEKSLP